MTYFNALIAFSNLLGRLLMQIFIHKSTGTKAALHLFINVTALAFGDWPSTVFLHRAKASPGKFQLDFKLTLGASYFGFKIKSVYGRVIQPSVFWWTRAKRVCCKPFAPSAVLSSRMLLLRGAVLDLGRASVHTYRAKRVLCHSIRASLTVLVMESMSLCQPRKPFIDILTKRFPFFMHMAVLE